MSEVKRFKLGTITNEKLTKSISHAMDLNTLSWNLETKDGKTVLNVYSDIDNESTYQLLEAIKQ